MNSYRRSLPLIVALPIFLQNLTGSVIATALPAIADSLNADVLHLNLAITLYLLSLAVFLPLSGWLADRFGLVKVGPSSFRVEANSQNDWSSSSPVGMWAGCL